MAMQDSGENPDHKDLKVSLVHKVQLDREANLDLLDNVENQEKLVQYI